MSGHIMDRPPLVEEVLSGRNRELQKLAAEGILPLPQENLIELQVHLAELDDEEVAGKARASLGALETLAIHQFLQQEAAPVVVSWFARNSKDPILLEGLIQRRDFSSELATEIAPRLSEDMQEILLLRQDLIVEHPEILEALERNDRLSTYASRRIAEYRRHLVVSKQEEEEEEEEYEDEESDDEEYEYVDDDEEADEEYEDDDEPGALDDISEEDFRRAIDEIKASVEPEGELDNETGLSEAQIRQLPPPMRAKLARGASRSLRLILIKDPNPVVAKSVLTASAITEPEIELVTTSRSVTEEVLTAIANNREWVRKYNIMHNLVKNPRTPVGIAIKNIPRLAMRDLSMLVRDRNVSDGVRQTARRIYNAKRK